MEHVHAQAQVAWLFEAVVHVVKAAAAAATALPLPLLQSNRWLTGAAPNAMAIGLAHQQGVQLPAGDWVTWVKGACMPALLIMAVTPLAVFGMYKPAIQRTPEAPKQAKLKLKVGLGVYMYQVYARFAIECQLLSAAKDYRVCMCLWPFRFPAGAKQHCGLRFGAERAVLRS
jgi:hypothetical protein